MLAIGLDIAAAAAVERLVLSSELVDELRLCHIGLAGVVVVAETLIAAPLSRLPLELYAIGS